MNANVRNAELRELRARAHRNCFVCSPSNDRGLHLEYTPMDDGSVQAVFDGGYVYEGYSRMLHGGVIASILDGAMTNCLFAHGHCAATAELTVRYRHPVEIGHEATVSAKIKRSCPPLHLVEASLVQDEDLKAVARGKFLELPSIAD